MSSLIVANDLHMMMLELAVNSVYVPWRTVFDRVILKKTTVMFRMLDDEWTTVYPQTSDNRPYCGSNRELELFHGGTSLVFSVPESTLEENVNGVDLQLCVYREICKHFEMDSCQNLGFLVLRVDHLFNGIIKELRERKELADYLSSRYQRQPVSRSLKGKYPLMNDALGFGGASIDLYVRLSYLGKCVITEIDLTDFECKAFHARQERSDGNPYECRELTDEDVRAGRSFKTGPNLPPPDLRKRLLTCQCDQLTDSTETIQGTGEPGHQSARDQLSAKRKKDLGSEEDEDVEDVTRGKRKRKEPKGKHTGMSGDTEAQRSRDRKGEGKDSKVQSRVKDTEKENVQPGEYKGRKKGNPGSKGAKENRERTTNTQKLGKKNNNPGQKAAEQEANKNSARKKSFQLGEEHRDILALIMSNRRCRGTATVGIQDKKKRICPARGPKLPACQPCCIPLDCYRPVCFT